MARPESARWFRGALIGVVLAGLTIRLVYVLVSRQFYDFAGDAYFYHAGANVLADGHGFISPFYPNQTVQAAEHPPLYVMYLAIPSVLGMQSVLAHLVWSTVLGAVTVAIIGLAGREIAGPRVGIIAAALAAVYPNVWVPDTSLMAETLAISATAFAVWFAYRYWRAPSTGRLVLVAVAGGLGALSRSELILLVPMLVVPLALLVPGPDRRRRWIGIGAATMAGVAVVAPWIIFNFTRFEQPVFLTSSYGSLLSSADCEIAWGADHKSYFSQQCTIDIRDREMPAGRLDQSEQDEVYRKAALRYISANKSRIPGVVAARLGAIVGLYHPSRQINIDSLIEGRDLWLARSGMYSFYALALLSIAGAIVLRRSRRAPLFPLLVPPVVVLITVVVTYASTRFRSSAEVVLCILAAVAIDAAVTAWIERGRSRTAATDEEPKPAT